MCVELVSGFGGGLGLELELVLSSLKVAEISLLDNLSAFFALGLSMTDLLFNLKNLTDFKLKLSS